MNHRSTQRHFLQDSLEEALSNGNYYEALQLYLSISQRYIKQKKQEEAMEILQSGIHELVKSGQMQAAIELSEKLLGTFEEPWRPSYRKHILEVLKAISLPLPVSKSFLSSALELSIKLNSGQHDPLLHGEVAKLYLKSGDMEGSIDHFIKAPSSYLGSLSEAIAGISTTLNQDLAFMTLLTVTKFIKSKKVQEAANILDHVIVSCPEITNETICNTNDNNNDLQIQFSEEFPLLNLAQLFVLAMQRSNKDVLKEILQHYQPLISKYPELCKELNSFTMGRSENRSNAPSSTGSSMGDLFNQVFRGIFQPQPRQSETTQPDID